MNPWILMYGAVLLLAASVPQPTAASAEDDGRLVYEIVVTNPGTRSQGWHGTFYDKAGPVSLPPGKTIETQIGTFEGVACAHQWSTCGVIRAEMLAWMKTHQANVIMGREPWSYRLYVLHEGTRSEGFQGRLYFNGAEITACEAPRPTPMGPFVCKVRSTLWDRAGWYHESWPEAR